MLNNQNYVSLNGVALATGVPIDWLVWATYLESNHNPAAINGNAVGLMQWMPGTLKDIGYTTPQVHTMSFAEQCVVMQKYIKKNWGLFKKAKSFIDFYLIMFYPAASGKGDSYIFPSIVTKYNPAFDKNGDRLITMQEFKANVFKRLKKQYPSAEPEQTNYIKGAGSLFSFNDKDNGLLLGAAIVGLLLLLVSSR